LRGAASCPGAGALRVYAPFPAWRLVGLTSPSNLSYRLAREVLEFDERGIRRI
jgi:hypothetical protein